MYVVYATLLGASDLAAKFRFSIDNIGRANKCYIHTYIHTYKLVKVVELPNIFYAGRTVKEMRRLI